MEILNTILKITLIQVGRYIVFASLAYYAFWMIKNKITDRYRIQKQDFKKAELLREFKQSLLSLGIFGVILSFSLWPGIKERTQLYFDLSEHSLWWATASLIILIAVHDTYFYWMHRAVHSPALFKLVHKVHHLSTNPSPYTSYSFHPLESILESIWILPILFAMPVHYGVLLVFSFITLYINIVGHLGVETYPESWKKNAVLKWLNRSTYHNHHHKYFTGNYGLYFIFWDTWMGTLREEELELVPPKTSEHRLEAESTQWPPSNPKPA